VPTNHEVYSVDTPADLAKVEKIMQRDNMLCEYTKD